MEVQWTFFSSCFHRATCRETYLQFVSVLAGVERCRDELETLLDSSFSDFGLDVVDAPQESARVVERRTRHAGAQRRQLLLLPAGQPAHEQQVLLHPVFLVLVQRESRTLWIKIIIQLQLFFLFSLIKTKSFVDSLGFHRLKPGHFALSLYFFLRLWVNRLWFRTLNRHPASLKGHETIRAGQLSLRCDSSSSRTTFGESHWLGQAMGKRPHLAWWACSVSKPKSLAQ